MASRPLHVLVATPLGAGGQGGIDRLMDSLREELRAGPDRGVEVTFRPTRGQGSIALSPFVLAGFCGSMLADRLRGRLDLVHVNLASAGSTYRKLVVSNLAKVLGVPVVIHLHGGGMADFWDSAPRWIQRRITAMFSSATRIVVLGRIWVGIVRDRAPGTESRITVLANATPVPKLAHRGGGDIPHIAFLGRLGPSKGVPELVEALATLPGGRNWRATLAGDGDVQATRALVDRAGLTERVSVPGWMGPDAVADLLASADIVVLPSHVENLPMVVIEAMAMGAAVIATPAGATRDIVEDGETGLLVPIGDAAALSRAIDRLLADPALRKRLSEAGLKQHRKMLDMRPYADRLVAIWKEAAGRSAEGASSMEAHA